MNLNIETVTHDEYYEVIVAGELDVYTVPELEEVLMQMRQEGTHDIHVNVTNVSYMDSGIRFICRNIKSFESK